MRKQIARVEAGGGDSAEYGRVARRGIIVGALLAVIVTVIVFLLVTKPNPLPRALPRTSLSVRADAMA